MEIKSIEDLMVKARKKGKKRCICIKGEDETSLKALYHGLKEGIIKPVIYGDEEIIRKEAERLDIPLDEFEIHNVPDEREAAREGVIDVKENGDFLLKGFIKTSVFLKAVLDKEAGLRTGRVLSHVAVIEPPGYGKLLFFTDGGMNIKPDLKMKVDIIMNAVELAHKFGIKEPKVALVSAIEVVNPDIPDTMDWAVITKMNERKQIKNCIVDGPMALDVAVSREAAEIKKVFSPVAGNADIIVQGDISASNATAKSLIYLAGAKACGIVVGAKKPVVMLSRSDSPETKFNSIVLGAVAVEEL